MNEESELIENAPVGLDTPTSINRKIDEKVAQSVSEALTHDENAVPYVPISDCPPLSSVVPLNLLGESLEALSVFKEQDIDIDSFLMNKLQYNSKVALCNALGAEQADAVALAILQMDNKMGFILGDMAGIGKGRVCAAILRYAYLQNLIPVFITEKPNLFTDNYRDILNVGGFKTNKDGRGYAPTPLILNGYRSPTRKIYYNEEGEKIVEKLPAETTIVDENTGETLFVGPQSTELKEIFTKKRLPRPYDYIVATYSQFTGSSWKNGKKVDKPRQQYIRNISEKCVFILDECHNASGNTSQTSMFFRDVCPNANGTLFSSATFAKRPENMWIYSFVTDIEDSALSTAALLDAIEEGGLKLQEYLASSLVRTGQMVRRERSYDNCNILYNYMPESSEPDLFNKYDTAITQFLKLKTFTERSKFANAKLTAKERFAKSKKVELAYPRPDSSDKGAIEEWHKENKGKFECDFSVGNMHSVLFHFIETLLFSLKAEYVTNVAISQYTNNKLININKDLEAFKSNRKPVVAVRSTLETIYDKIGIEIGDIIPKNDLSLYLNAVVNNVLKGKIKLKEIVLAGKARSYEDAEFSIDLLDFSDKGLEYTELVEDSEDVEFNIPLSPIDYVLDTFNATPRPKWDTFGVGETLNMGEITGRKYRLLKVKGGYQLTINKKDKNKFLTFSNFNNGTLDGLILNTAGATGASAHSSKEFDDQRPRSMIIHQVELDVNTECQKRGRINRTGQENFPTYIYAISRIPSEIRRLLMLKRKLRSLDANTTANEAQTSSVADIQDTQGNEIQDIYNKYGIEVLENFLEDEANFYYRQYWYFDDDEGQERHWSKGELTMDDFARNLQMAPAYKQKIFYNDINAMYLSYIENLKASGMYELETEIEDLQASIKTRLVAKKGMELTPFSESVYIEDDYVLMEQEPLTKEKLDELTSKLCDGKRPDKWYAEFIENYKKYSIEFGVSSVKDWVKQHPLKIPKGSTPNEEATIKEKWAERKKSYKEKLFDQIDYVGFIFEKFQPGTPIQIPSDIDDGREAENLDDYKGNWNNAKFVGYKLNKGESANRYSPGNIDMVFAQLSGDSKLVIKPTAMNNNLIDLLVLRKPRILGNDYDRIKHWVVDPSRRELMRLYSGNILDAYPMASNKVQESDNSYRFKFVKFTTLDDTAIRFGIRLYMTQYVELEHKQNPISIPIAKDEFLTNLGGVQWEKDVRDTSQTLIFQKVRNSENTIKVYVIGGSKAAADKARTKGVRISSIRQSPFFYNEQFKEVRGDVEWEYDSEGTRFKMRGSGKRFKYVNRFAYFDLTNELNLQQFNAYREFFWASNKLAVTFYGEGAQESDIYDEPDIYTEGQEDEKREEGRFEYKLTRPFAKGKMPKSFIEYIDDGTRFGKIIVKFENTAPQSLAWNMVPINNTVSQMMNTFFGLFKDKAKTDAITEIKDKIAKGESDADIGMYLFKKTNEKVGNFKYVFGDGYSIPQLGEIARNWSQSGESEEKLPPTPEKQGKKEKELPKVALDFKSADDFLTLMSH